MDEPYDPRFPELDYLFGCYLNQDYVIHGRSIGDAVRAYTRAERPEIVAAIRSEIARLLAHGAGREAAELDRFANSRAHPPGLSGADYLRWIDSVLAEPERRAAE